jgi:hypothetical protein
LSFDHKLGDEAIYYYIHDSTLFHSFFVEIPKSQWWPAIKHWQSRSENIDIYIDIKSTADHFCEWRTNYEKRVDLVFNGRTYQSVLTFREDQNIFRSARNYYNEGRVRRKVVFMDSLSRALLQNELFMANTMISADIAPVCDLMGGPIVRELVTQRRDSGSFHLIDQRSGYATLREHSHLAMFFRGQVLNRAHPPAYDQEFTADEELFVHHCIFEHWYPDYGTYYGTTALDKCLENIVSASLPLELKAHELEPRVQRLITRLLKSFNRFCAKEELKKPELRLRAN